MRLFDRDHNFASQSFRTPVKTYFALDLLNHFPHYARAKAFVSRRDDRWTASFGPC